MPKSTHTIACGALAMLVTLAATTAANAQYGTSGYYNRGNFGRRQDLRYQHRRGIRVERPRAAVLGGLLTGIGRGLHAENPQRHAVASNILNGLGNGFHVASQPTIFNEGRITKIDRGYYSNRGGSYYDNRPYAVNRPIINGGYPSNNYVKPVGYNTSRW